MDAELRAEDAVPVGQDPAAHPVEEVVAGAEGQDLLDRHRLGLVGGAPLPQRRRGAGGRLVGRERMHRVVDVLEVGLPVAADHRAQRRALDGEPARGGAVDQVVDRGQRLAEVGGEVDPARVDPGEDEVAVHRDAGRRLHAARRLARRVAAAVVAAGQRHRAQRAVEAVGPGVVRAAEEPAGVAAPVADQRRALVGAAVVEHAHRAVVAAHHHQRPAGQIDGRVVAGVRHLAGVADVVPGVGEEVLLLEREQLRAQVEVAVHPLVLDQRGDLGPVHAVRP